MDAEEIVRRAVSLGYLSPTQLAEARARTTADTLLYHLGQHYLTKEQVESLRVDVGDATLAAGSPGAEPIPQPTAPYDSRPAPPCLGDRLGEYELVRSLARGGMGLLFVARDADGNELALKVQHGGAPLARFKVEAGALAALDHPGVVGVHDFGVDPQGRAYLVMDLVEGESLAERLGREEVIPQVEAARLTLDLARALSYVHAQGVLHRDLKPHNVMLPTGGGAVVTDFGLARVVDQSQHISITGEPLGTPAYMSPEQAKGLRDAMGPRSDVYGLGATLYHALTGSPPFSESQPIQLIMAAIHQEPEPPSSLRPQIDPVLEGICLTCLAKDPDDRYPSMLELAADLDAFLRVTPTNADLAGDGVKTEPDSRPPKAAAAPTRIDRYEVVRELARGGMGIVYVARDSRLEREVALKQLLPRRGTTRVHLERFAREAKAVARLQHPNIVQVYDAGKDSAGAYFMVMEMVEGESLASRVEREGPLGQPQAVKLALQLAQALDYAHARGILHRDLKPENILLTTSEEVPKITDFGLAKLLSPADDATPVSAGEGDGTVKPKLAALTVAGRVIGTPAYMSPEQAGGTADARSDVYGLGATLYGALTGSAPIEAESLVAALGAVLTGSFPRPSALRPDLDPELEGIILRCMALDPEDRYQSARELGAALSQYLKGAHSAPASDEPPEWLRFVLIGVALVAILGAGLSFLLSGSPSAESDLDEDQAVVTAESGSADAEPDSADAEPDSADAEPDGADAEVADPALLGRLHYRLALEALAETDSHEALEHARTAVGEAPRDPLRAELLAQSEALVRKRSAWSPDVSEQEHLQLLRWEVDARLLLKQLDPEHSLPRARADELTPAVHAVLREHGVKALDMVAGLVELIPGYGPFELGYLRVATTSGAADPDQALGVAKSAYEHATERRREATTLQYLLALRRVGRLESFAAIVERAERDELSPRTLTHVYAVWGNTLQEQGHPQEAVPKLKRAVELNPRGAWAYTHLFRAYRDLDQPDLALEHARAYLERVPRRRFSLPDRERERVQEAVDWIEGRGDPAEIVRALRIMVEIERDAIHAASRCARLLCEGGSATAADLDRLAGCLVARAERVIRYALEAQLDPTQIDPLLERLEAYRRDVTTEMRAWLEAGDFDAVRQSLLRLEKALPSRSASGSSPPSASNSARRPSLGVEPDSTDVEPDSTDVEPDGTDAAEGATEAAVAPGSKILLREDFDDHRSVMYLSKVSKGIAYSIVAPRGQHHGVSFERSDEGPLLDGGSCRVRVRLRVFGRAEVTIRLVGVSGGVGGCKVSGLQGRGWTIIERPMPLRGTRRLAPLRSDERIKRVTIGLRVRSPSDRFEVDWVEFLALD